MSTASKDATTALVDSIPPCDFCGYPAKYDARIKGLYTWGYMCDEHMFQLGSGLGEGLGQKLVLRSNNERTE